MCDHYDLSVISDNEQLECGTFMYALSYEYRFDTELFDRLLTAVSRLMQGQIVLEHSTVYELYSIQRMVLTLIASHHNPHDLFVVVSSTKADWLEDLGLLDTTIYACLKAILK